MDISHRNIFHKEIRLRFKVLSVSSWSNLIKLPNQFIGSNAFTKLLIMTSSGPSGIPTPSQSCITKIV